jgi:hypothetical protein
MPLTNAQYLLLRQDIASDPALAGVPQTQDGAMFVADTYNLPASPVFWVWKTVVTPEEYTGGNSIVWTAVDQLSAGKARIWEWMTGGLTRSLNAADPNIQAGIREAFNPGSSTTTNLQAIARRQASRAEALFATGTGSPASPGTMTFEGLISWTDIFIAWGVWSMPS